MTSTSDPIEAHHVTVSGNPAATRSIVFVNGFGTDQSAWGKVAPAFAADFRLITFDQAGTGSWTGAFAQHRYLNLRAYASDLAVLLDRMALDRAVVVGHSVGGMIALLAAIERPERIGRLVMLGSSPRYLDEPGYRGGFSERDLNELYRSVTLDYVQWADQFAPLAMNNPDRPQLAHRVAASLKTIPAQHALTALCAIFQSDHRADLPRLRQPALVVQSQDDIAVPLDVARYLQAHIADSELVIVDAKGHFPHISEPERVIAAIEGFVRA